MHVECHGIYNRRMPREPKAGNFVIKTIRPTELGSVPFVPVDADHVVPARFSLIFELSEPPLVVRITIVMEGTKPSVRHLEITRGHLEYGEDPSVTRVVEDDGAITTTVLRQVLIDQLVRAALEKVRWPKKLVSETRQTILTRLPAEVAEEAYRILESSAPGRPATKTRIAQAADAYKKAVAAGSKAPQKEVALAMGFSTSQVSRYLKSARENGLLDPESE